MKAASILVHCMRDVAVPYRYYGTVIMNITHLMQRAAASTMTATASVLSIDTVTVLNRYNII